MKPIFAPTAVESGEWAQAMYLRTFGTDVLHAHYVQHRFARHAHPEFVIAYVESGVNAHYFRGSTISVPAKHIAVVNPEEPHMGCSAGEDGFTYRVLYPSHELMNELATELTGTRPSGNVFFRQPVCADSDVVRALAALHISIANGACALEVEERFVVAMTLLLLRGADKDGRRCNALEIHTSPSSVHRAREMIVDRFCDELSLAQLAGECGMSPFHLQRVFRHSWGLSPHEFQTQLRVFRAKELLKRGESLSGAAAEVGLYDQSHLNRHFKRILGITPGQYQRAIG